MPAPTYKFGGHTFHLRTKAEISIKAIKRLKATVDGGGDDPFAMIEATDDMVRMILGPEQYATLDALDEEMTIADAGALIEMWEKAMGGALPKSAGSPKSSKSTKIR